MDFGTERQSRSRIALLVAFAFSTGILNAEVNTWTGLGLTDATIVAMAADPQHRGTFYVASARSPSRSDGHILYRTDDQGQNWVDADAGLPSPGSVAALAVSPGNPSTILVGMDYLAGTGAQIFMSTNGGSAWMPASEGLPANPPAPGRAWRRVATIAIDPLHPGTIYAGILSASSDLADVPSAVYKSTHGGTSWRPAGSGLPASTGITGATALAIDQRNPDILYAAGTFGVFKSSDAGEHWTAANAGLSLDSYLFSVYNTALAIDPNDSTIVYVSLYGVGLYKSTDQGTTWAPTKLSSPTFNGATLAIDANSPNVLYSGTANYCYCYDDGFPNGIARSTDGGTTWAAFNAGLRIPEPPFAFSIYALVIDPFDSTIVYAATSAGVFVATEQQ